MLLVNDLLVYSNFAVNISIRVTGNDKTSFLPNPESS